MNYSDAIEYIESFKTVSLSPSLDRIKRVLSILDNPEKDLKVIQIAGTNGKGSVAEITAAVLSQMGYKVGLYISPYVIDFCERIQINGEMIPKNILAELCTKAKARIEKEKSPLILSQFELTTALAFMYFKRENCDFCVLEAGLGGKYDATNVIEKPLCSVLTKISLDHTKVLGNTIEEITSEKCGIIKSQVPLITCCQDETVLKIITDECKKNNSKLRIADTSLCSDIRLSLKETAFTFEGVKFSIPLLGKHQVENSLMAIMVLEEIMPRLNSQYINEGFSKVSHPGRLELVSETPSILLDGAHNPGAAKALKDFLISVGWKGNILFSAMKDKKYEEVLELLSELSSDIAVVQVENNPRAESGKALESCGKKYFRNVTLLENYDEAEKLLSSGGWLVCGSLFLVSDLRQRIIN